MLVKRKYIGETDRRKNMEGIKEEEKVMEIPCTGLLGSFVSTSLIFKIFYFVLILQYKQFNCQKLMGPSTVG